MKLLFDSAVTRFTQREPFISLYIRNTGERIDLSYATTEQNEFATTT